MAQQLGLEVGNVPTIITCAHPSPAPKPKLHDLQTDLNLRPFLAFSVGRQINVHSEADYQAVLDYQEELGHINGAYDQDEDGEFVPRFDIDDKKSSMVSPEQLHVTHLYAQDVGSIILRNFARDNGQIIKPPEVKRRISRFVGRYNKMTRRDNELLQDHVLYDRGLSSNAPRRTLDESVLTDETLAMTNGIFRLAPMLGAYGMGNVFGFNFTSEASRYLQSERSRALDMATDVMGVKHLDRDIEHKILSREHHVTLMRLGIKMPDWEVVLPRYHHSLMPDSFVTEFDAKARTIMPHADS